MELFTQWLWVRQLQTSQLSRRGAFETTTWTILYHHCRKEPRQCHRLSGGFRYGTAMTSVFYITHRIHGAAILMVTFTINIPQMLAYIPAPWILWVMEQKRTCRIQMNAAKHLKPPQYLKVHLIYKLLFGPSEVGLLRSIGFDRTLVVRPRSGSFPVWQSGGK